MNENIDNGILENENTENMEVAIETPPVSEETVSAVEETVTEEVSYTEDESAMKDSPEKEKELNDLAAYFKDNPEALKELEDMILGAEDKLYALEYELYCEVRERVASEMLRIQKTAKAIAQIDVLASLALVAERGNFVRPNINEKGVIDIKNGRHPVVESMIEHDMFIANDTYLDDRKNRISIITGPNMAGKSTFMKAVSIALYLVCLQNRSNSVIRNTNKIWKYHPICNKDQLLIWVLSVSYLYIRIYEPQ